MTAKPVPPVAAAVIKPVAAASQMALTLTQSNKTLLAPPESI